MNTSLIATVYSLLIVVLLTGCAASVQSTYSPESKYYEGCEGSWDEIRKCAEEKEKESAEADSVKDTTEFSADKMAVIVDSYWGTLRYSKAGIWGVDGAALHFTERVKVPPGEHMVTIYCAHGYGLGSQLFATIKQVVFVAKSDHKYQVKCSETDGAWVEDTATNEVVGNERTRSLASTGHIKALRAEAKAGDAEAQLQLYYVEREQKASLKWLCRAADQGQRHAQKELASEYETGSHIVRQDLVQAYVWYTLAIRAGAEEYRSQLDALAERMTPEQIEEAERQFSVWAPGQCEQALVPVEKDQVDK